MNELVATIGQPLMDMRSYVNHVGKKRYYSSTDAVVSFKGVKLEEVCTIQWTVNEPKQPLFGYNSYTFDEVATGARIIQGSFVINFIIPNYLNLILDDSKKSTDNDIIYKNDGTENKTDHHKQYFPESFMIDIGYGKENDTITGQRPHIFLENVFISQATQLCDPNGTPIMEQYSFIARDCSNSR